MSYKKIIIGVDQSYERTGITITADGEIKKITYIDLGKYKFHSESRKALREYLEKIISKLYKKGEIAVVIERIRLKSDGFLNINYIKGIGALNSIIIDTMFDYGIDVYSVDTRAWKSRVIGTVKPQENKYGVDPKKWPTIKWLIEKGYEKDILIEVTNKRKNKGTFIRNGKKYMYNDDAADSAGISLFYFVNDKKELLQLEN